MTSLRPMFTQLYVALILALGKMPGMVTLLDVMARPTIARVNITRRRRLAYADFFTATDVEGRRAAPIARSATRLRGRGPTRGSAPQETPDRTYIVVHTA
jgi:hypothetical protein